MPSKFFFAIKKNDFLKKMVKNNIFSQILALMSFDGPDQILPIFHHLMSFDGPKNLMSFDGPKPRFSPFKISCLLMDPIGTYIFKVFPSKTSCLLMDPLLN